MHSCVSIASVGVFVLFAAIAASAQPAGQYVIYSQHISGDCSSNSTIAFSMTRINGRCGRVSSETSAYITCNETDIINWRCPSTDCSGECYIDEVGKTNECTSRKSYLKKVCVGLEISGMLPTLLGGLTAVPVAWHATVSFNDTSAKPVCNMDTDSLLEITAYGGQCLYDPSSSKYTYLNCNSTQSFFRKCDDPLCTINCTDEINNAGPGFGVCPTEGDIIIRETVCVQPPPPPPPVAVPVSAPVGAPQTATPSDSASPVAASVPAASLKSSSPAAVKVPSASRALVSSFTLLLASTIAALL